MDERQLLLRVCSPREELLRRRVRALRVPTETGWVGVLPRAEPAALVVEPGLVVVRCDHAVVLVGTAGGLLRVGRDEAVLLSPIVVIGDDAATVRERIEALSVASSAEAELRRRIERLERGLVAEAGRRGRTTRAGSSVERR